MISTPAAVEAFDAVDGRERLVGHSGGGNAVPPWAAELAAIIEAIDD